MTTQPPARALAGGIATRFGIAPLCVLAACLAAGLGVWHMGLCWPDATTRLRDDAFYEFAWAANVAAGRGPTISDGVTTSGVQLLWSLLLVPIAALGGAAMLPVLAPVLGFLLHALTALLWWRHVRDRTTAACIALCWLGHPLLLRECGNGQETALAGLLASGLWFRRTTTPGRFVALAIVATLARTDLLALVALLALWRVRRHGPAALLAPAVAFAVACAANWLLGGGLVQDSALPMAWLWHENLAAADPTGTQFGQHVWWFLRPALLGGPFASVSAFGCGLAVFLVARPVLPAGARALPALLVGCATALGARDLLTPGIVALLLAVLPAAGRRALPAALLAALLGLGAIVALHWAVRWYPRDYYLVPLFVVAAAAVQRCGRHRLLLLAFAAAQAADIGRVRAEPLAGQAEMQMAGQFLGELLPPGERVGCFNSGLVTFHADVLAGPERRRGIVNLDGVVDARSFAALRAGELGAWLDRLGVRFVLDNPVQFGLDPSVPHACGRWFGGGFAPERDLVELARFDVPGLGNGRPGGDSMRLYHRTGRGPVPTMPAVPQDLGVAATGARCVLWPARAGQRLLVADASGGRTPLLTADVATVVVLALPGPAEAARALFVDGVAEPVLHLVRL